MASYTQTDVLQPHMTLLPDTETTDVTKVGDGEDGEEGEQERKKWSRKTEYMLSVIGYCVGLGNLLRFPYMCNRNGGGKHKLGPVQLSVLVFFLLLLLLLFFRVVLFLLLLLLLPILLLLQLRLLLLFIFTIIINVISTAHDCLSLS